MCARSCSWKLGRAHNYAPIEGEQYVDLAPERARWEKCAKLLFTLSGLRTAASSWEKERTKTMEQAGFVTGLATACTFFHKGKNIRVVEHDDDVIIEGPECGSRPHSGRSTSSRCGRCWAQSGRTTVADILNRVVEWKHEELWYEADPRYVEESAVPGTTTAEQDDSELLDRESVKRYRLVVARGTSSPEIARTPCTAQENCVGRCRARVEEVERG